MSYLLEQLKRHEGLKLKPYHCTAGKLTIGYGRNLDDVGITEQEAEQLLLDDVAQIKTQLKIHLPWYQELSAVRQAVLENMAFNLGLSRLLQFRRMLAAAQTGDFDTAATEMQDSKWARQVGHRSIELTKQMRTGEWQ
jgi:lysozyme